MTAAMRRVPAVAFVDPAATDDVFPEHRIRSGNGRTQPPRFADDRWDLAWLAQDSTSRSRAFLWSNFPEELRDSFKRIAWAMINIPTPDVLHHRVRSKTRAVMAWGSLMQVFTNFRAFARWMQAQGINAVCRIDRDALDRYAQSLAEKGWTDGADERRLFTLSRIWAFAPLLLQQDRLVMPPWDEPGSSIPDYLEDFQRATGENDTIVVHPATMSPLLVWALRTVLQFAPDIAAAYRERRRLEARIPQSAAPSGTQKVRDYLHLLRQNKEPVPTYAGALCWQTSDPQERPTINISYIAGLLAVNKQQVEKVLLKMPPDLGGCSFADGAALSVPVVGTIDGMPWTGYIDFTEARSLAQHLTTAAMITVGYLSGMRPEEVLHLERGCSLREQKPDGTVRYTLTGRHFKGVRDTDGNSVPAGRIRSEPWTVIELVDRAVKAMEMLHDHGLLFPRILSVRAQNTEGSFGEAVSPIATIGRISSFIAWANTQAERHGRRHEMIPADPSGPVTLRRLRRTVAWFIYRQPGGRIALGLQYGHVGDALAESYGGRTKADMLQILDFEKTLTMADTLAAASDRLAAGEGVSGPAADAYIAAARMFNARFGGTFATKAQIKALQANPSLHVYDNPEAMLTCNYDPFKALCDPQLARGGTPQRTPNLGRCNAACANISRTDTHMIHAREEVKDIDSELADGLNPHPLEVRLRQRRDNLVRLIEQHRETRRRATGLEGAP